MLFIEEKNRLNNRLAIERKNYKELEGLLEGVEEIVKKLDEDVKATF